MILHSPTKDKLWEALSLVFNHDIITRTKQERRERERRPIIGGTYVGLSKRGGGDGRTMKILARPNDKKVWEMCDG